MDSPALARLLGGLATDQFIADFWEIRPYHHHRDDASFYNGLMQWADVEQLVGTMDLPGSRMRLVDAHSGGPIDLPKRHDGGVDSAGMVDHLADGATLVFNAVHLVWEPLALLCRHLEKDFSHPFQANLYVTPAQGRGLPVHMDNHDVFVLQIHGEKRWQLYPPHPAPTKHDAGALDVADAGEPDQVLHLRPGDLLYLPRGVPHVADSVTASAHITIGMLSTTWQDAMHAAVDLCAAREPGWRQALPVRYDQLDAADMDANAVMTQLCADLANALHGGDVLAAVHREFVQQCRPLVDGVLTMVTEPTVDVQDFVSVRESVVYSKIHEADAVCLLFHGKRIEIPDKAADAVDVLCRQKAARVADLSESLDDAGKLVLARRLIREGFAQRVAADSV